MRCYALLFLVAFCISGSVFPQAKADTNLSEPAVHTWIPDYDLKTGAVFTMSNGVTNMVFAFHRERTGTLRQVGYFLTGASGDPVPRDGTSVENPLGSQNSLVKVPGRHILLAVNAGSNLISVFRIESRSLTRRQLIKSRGIRPVSIAVFEDLVYVVNAGDAPNISGFRILEDDTLEPINDSLRPLSTGTGSAPAQIGFSPEGNILFVTERRCGCIETFSLDRNGIPQSSRMTASSGGTPIGFAFSNNGHLLVAEGDQSTGSVSTLSSYTASLFPLIISQSVSTTNSGTCCLAVTNNARFAYVINSRDFNVSSFSVQPSGVVQLLDSAAAAFDKTGFPVEAHLTDSGRFMYILDSSNPTIYPFAIGFDGTLKPLPNGGLLPRGIQGLAAY